MGESGSGKSTLMRVLAGLYAPQHATFTIDGTLRPDIIDLGGIATLLPQDPEIFESTVEHNITMGLEHGAEAVRRVCDLTCFAPVVEALPAGPATVISERGVNLSGGQKQRLALARGMLAARDSSLILLDEPTSSIDPTTESLIYDALFREFADACIVSSVHRLHLLPRFDLVVLMQDGRILDRGSVADLLARQAGFRALWRRSALAPEGAPAAA
jgi:ABC-type multidrug transport system fused ATPase/permease subunit